MTDDKIKKLEEEINAKKKEVEELKYGDLKKAWNDFQAASEIATQKYNKYKEIAKDHSNLFPPELTIKALMLFHLLKTFAHFFMTQKIPDLLKA